MNRPRRTAAPRAGNPAEVGARRAATDLIDEVATPGREPRRVAVIDIGTSAIRLALAEIDDEGRVRPLTSLVQAVNLGRDTFVRGVIEKSTIEECVRILKSYRRFLTEYRVDRQEQIRVVATSAVREATNQLAFLDRVYSATGINVQPLDLAEVSRITYLGVQPQLKRDPELARALTLVAEVGAGNTELLLVQDGNVRFAQVFRVGAIRLRETVEAFRASQSQLREVLEQQIRRMAEQMSKHLGGDSVQKLVLLGGDIRFAAREMLPDWRPDELTRMKVSDLETLTAGVLALSEDKLVHRYHISFPDAATLGPALLANLLIAKSYHLNEVIVSSVNLRDGLLQDLAAQGAWNDDFSNQVVRSAIELGRKFNFSEPHARHVAKLCKILFQGLREEHQLPPRYELLLTITALLHEIGLYVGTSGYHKHTMYLIQNSELFGLGQQDVRLIAMAARYHRRASPKPTHSPFTTLPRDQRLAIVKLAALLRVADALDASNSQRLHELRLSREAGRLVISIPGVEDLSLETFTLKQSGALFEETFGMPVLLRRLRM